LKVRDSLRQNIHDELVLSGDSLPDALVDVVKRDLRRVQPARLRLRLRFRHETPPAYQGVLSVRRHSEFSVYAFPVVEHYTVSVTRSRARRGCESSEREHRLPNSADAHSWSRRSPISYNANHGPWSISMGGQRSKIKTKDFVFIRHGLGAYS